MKKEEHKESRIRVFVNYFFVMRGMEMEKRRRRGFESIPLYELIYEKKGIVGMLEDKDNTGEGKVEEVEEVKEERSNEGNIIVWMNLAEEIWLLIAKYLTIKDLLSLSSVNYRLSR